MAVPRGKWPSLGHSWLLPPNTHTTHTSTHPAPLAGCYRKLRERNKALKWQGHQDGTECCTSQFPLNCHHPALVTHMPETSTHTHSRTHSCFMPTSKSGQFLTVTFCLPAKHRQTQTLKNGSTLLRSGEVSCFAQSSVKTLTMRKNEWSNGRFQCNKLLVEFLVSGTQLSPKVINYILHRLLSLGF